MSNSATCAPAAPQREAILANLRAIQDPCSVSAGRPMDIVQMGLIGDLDINGATVRLSLVLTEPVCWFSKDLIAFAKDRIEMTDGVSEAEVYLDAQSIWTPDRIESLPPFLGRFPIVARAGA